jgi:hypothetical protein
LVTDHRGLNKFGSKEDDSYIKVRDGIKDLVSHAPAILARVESGKRLEVLKWISVVEYDADHRRVQGSLLENTGLWMFNKTEFRDWQNSEVSNVLLLCGIRKCPNFQNKENY